MRRDNKRKQAGFVMTAEVLLVTTVLAIGLITGLVKVRDQALSELVDTGQAVGSIDQSYTLDGTTWNATTAISSGAGFSFLDDPDTAANNGNVGGDQQVITYTEMNAAGASNTAAGTENTLVY